MCLTNLVSGGRRETLIHQRESNSRVYITVIQE
jgi:hypothetical protein